MAVGEKMYAWQSKRGKALLLALLALLVTANPGLLR